MKWLLPAALFCALPCYAQLPDMPKPKVVDKKFWFAVSTLAAAKATDAVTTRRMLDRGCRETDPLFGSHPSNARLVTVNALEMIGEATLAYSLKRFSARHRWAKHLWLIEPTFQASSHVYFAARNEGLRCQ